MKPEELREGYVGWCPYVDYMMEDKEYPHSWTGCKKNDCCRIYQRVASL